MHNSSPGAPIGVPRSLPTRVSRVAPTTDVGVASSTVRPPRTTPPRKASPPLVGGSPGWVHLSLLLQSGSSGFRVGTDCEKSHVRAPDGSGWVPRGAHASPFPHRLLRRCGINRDIAPCGVLFPRPPFPPAGRPPGLSPLLSPVSAGLLSFPCPHSYPSVVVPHRFTPWLPVHSLHTECPRGSSGWMRWGEAK